MTNNCKFHSKLKVVLAEYLGVKYISLFSNGTLAATSALQVLPTTGEVITTPYTFIAAINALLWNELTPIFDNVNPLSRNMDLEKIEAGITKDTAVILPVNVNGNPCKFDKIRGFELIRHSHSLQKTTS
jgi:dTDP-4-amino-4,6-dideoxygalactose transaminase